MKNNTITKEDQKRLEEIFLEASDNFKYTWGIKEFDKILDRYSEVKNEKILYRLGQLYDHLAMKDEENKEKHEKKALNIYNKILEINPESQKATWGIARVYWHRFSEEAVPYAKKAYKLAKKNKDKYGLYAQHIGLVYESLENYNKAEKWLKKGLELEPDNWEMYLNLLVFYRLISDFEKSKEIAKKLNKLYKKEPQEFRNSAWGRRIQKAIDNADQPLPTKSEKK